MHQQRVHAKSTELVNLEETIERLRARARMLRFQSYMGVVFIVLLAISLILIFSNHKNSQDQQSSVAQKFRNPYDYSLMETRHATLSEALSELITNTSEIKQELVTDKYVNNKSDQRAIIESLENQISQLQRVKLDLDDRLSKDRQNLSLEISRLRDERDAALREGGERKLFLILLGDVAFRVGALILAIYLTSVLFSLCRYLLRVADHLNSTADSIDLLRHSSLNVEDGIRALTPHPIEFHIEDSITNRTARDILGMFRDLTTIDRSGRT